MKRRIIDSRKTAVPRSTDTIRRSTHAQSGAMHANASTAYDGLTAERRLKGSSTIGRSLCVLLLVAFTALCGAAQKIYVATNTGYNGNPPNLANIAEYRPNGSLVNASFASFPTTYNYSLSEQGTNLFVPLDRSTNSTINKYNANTGKQLTYNIGTFSGHPDFIAAGGSHLFVLCSTGCAFSEYNNSTGALENSYLAAVPYAHSLGTWTDAGKNVSVYVVSDNSGGGTDNTGSIQVVKVNAAGVKQSQATLVSGLNHPQAIAVSADGQYVYVTTTITSTVYSMSKYNTSNGSLVWTAPQTITGDPFAMATSGGLVYVATTTNTVGAYYTSTGAVQNNALITTSNLISAIALGQPACITPPANMVAWYPFDTGSSTQIDLANSNTGTAYGTTSIVGEVSKALSFNGISDYLQAPEQTWLEMGTGNFSIDAWVKVANSADYDGVVALLDKRDSYTGYHMYIWNGHPGLQLADSSGFTNYSSTAIIPADNQWHLVAVSVARNSHTGGKWYLDGAPVGYFDPTAHNHSLNSTAPLEIGVRSSDQSGGGYFKGGIDELEIFNRGLTPAQVLSLMQAGHAGKCKL